ncbi:MAG TPA: MFS transporter [bacterium]|nr:MFS transporter [bacterium]
MANAPKRPDPSSAAWFQPAWLTRQVLALGLVALLTDMGTEMGMPLLPALIAGLGGGAVAVGLIDGLADAVAALLQVWAGRASDRSGRRKPYVFAGYSLSGLVRPLFGLAAAPWQVVAVRSADRVGKGVRKPSTNALLDQAATPATRGRVFGFYDAMDNAGQMLGPLLAMALLQAFAENLHKTLLCAIVPGALAALVVAFLVREHRAPKAAQAEPFPWIPPKAILPVLLPIAVFSLGNASDLFLLLKVHQGGAALWTQALLWAGYSAFKVVSALLGGKLSDRIGPRLTISLGWAFYAAVYTAFALATSLGAMTALFLAYGLFHGMSEGPLKALVGSLTPAKHKSTGYGWLGLTTGLVSLPAGLLFGWLWDAHGAPAAFGTGAGLALLGLALLWLAPRPTA